MVIKKTIAQTPVACGRFPANFDFSVKPFANYQQETANPDSRGPDQWVTFTMVSCTQNLEMIALTVLKLLTKTELEGKEQKQFLQRHKAFPSYGRDA